jgi:hypothetical protein
MAKGRKTGGRRKGTQNKLTIEVKSAIEGAFSAVGGQRYLERVARKHPTVFCALLARLIPKDLQVSAPLVRSDGETSMLETARRLAFVLTSGAREAERLSNGKKKN